ncbi:MAG: T9SS type A sorting domain-containing protein [Tannerella sp.]|nr:T9SS type A sorting domain-containing protein [Tannerella sp.]
MTSQDANGKDGKDAGPADLQSRSWIEEHLAWDFEEVWGMSTETGFPIIKTVNVIFMLQEAISYGERIPLSAFSNNTSTSILFTSSDDATAEISGDTLIARKAGTVAVTASQPAVNGYLPGDTTVNLTISPVSLTVSGDTARRTYGEQNPNFVLHYSGFVNNETEAVLTDRPAVSLQDITATSDAGTYHIPIEGGSAENYTFNYLKTVLIIEKADLTVSVQDAQREWGEANPEFTLACSGFRNGEDESVLDILPDTVCLADESSPVGFYDIILSGGMDKNYNYLPVDGKLEVIPARQNISFEEFSSHTYGDGTLVLPETSGSGLPVSYESDNPQVATVEGNILTITGAGTCSVTASQAGNENYSVAPPVSQTLVVDRALLTVAAEDKTREYGEENPPFTLAYSGFINDETESTLSQLPDVATDAQVTDNVGVYGITVSGGEANNYTVIPQSGTLTVTPALLTVLVDGKECEYGDDLPTLTYSIEGFKNGDTPDDIDLLPAVSVSAVAAVPVPVGTYSIEAVDASDNNYDFSYTAGQLTVAAATLTVAAADTAREYGAANPAFKIVCSGFKNGETEAVFSTQPLAASLAGATSDTGVYGIVVSGGTANNYAITHQDGTLTVDRAPLTVAAADTTREYGAANPAFKIVCSGFKNGETEAVFSTQPLAASLAEATSDTGVYDIVVSGSTANNYAITHQNGTLTVDRAPLTVAVRDTTRESGASNPAFTFTYSGFMNGEDASVLDRLPDVTCAANESSSPGFYAIELSGGSDNNYEYVFYNGRLEVTDAPTDDPEMPPEPVANPAMPQELTVYPNPARRDLYIRSDRPVSKVEIYSQVGVCVFVDDRVTGKIDISRLNDGIYVMRIYMSGTPQTRMIVVKH